MNIAVFADVHGRILLAFALCARWERETGERIDLILQAGDLGVYPERTSLDKATQRHAQADATELGFSQHFLRHDAEVTAALARTSCNLVFVRGNHEDHAWLDTREEQSTSPIFPVDAYRRIWCLKTGEPYTFQSRNAEVITIVGVGRVGLPVGEREHRKAKYIHQDELERIYDLGGHHIDVLLSHDAARDDISLGFGIEEIRLLLDQAKPAYHFFGHYGGACMMLSDRNGVTLSCKLADLHWDPSDRGKRLEAGSMGMLRWRTRDDHAFEVVDAPWLREYTAYTWRYLD